MSTEQILKVLKNERKCIARQNGKCDRNCAKCDLCLPDTEILEVYDHLIHLCESEAIIIADISEEDKEKIIRELANAGYGITPELEKKYLGNENPLSRKTFDGHRLGEIVVKDHGICKIVDVDGYAGYTMETIMPKEVFVEAYKKYIQGDTD